MAILFRYPFDAIFKTGVMLAGGSVSFYAPETTTLNTVYLDNALTTPAANPATLDSVGQLEQGAIYLGWQRYRVIVKDAAGTEVPNGDVEVDGVDVSQTINATWYGADPTGVADSIAAIIAAIIAASAARASGAVRVGVELPVGKYKISEPVPFIASVVLFCRSSFGAMLSFTGSAAEVCYSATLAGSTFTSTVGTAFNTSCTGAGAINIFVDATDANCNVTNAVAEINGAPECDFHNFYVSTDISGIDGMVFDHCVSPRLTHLRADKAGAATGGTGITTSGQTNAGVVDEPMVAGDWAVGILLGGSGNAGLGGVIESTPAIGYKVTGDNCNIRGTWIEGATTAAIQLGDTGSTAYNTTIDDCHINGAGIGLKIVEANQFQWLLSNRFSGTITNKFDGVASAALCNGLIQTFDAPDTFTTAGANLAGKGAILIEVFGTNDTGNHQRYAVFSTASNERVYNTGQNITAFTPAINFGGNAVGVTYAADGQVGYYWRDGKKIDFTLRLALTAKGSSTGVVTIVGLPATSRNITNLNYSFPIELTNVNLDVAGFYYTPSAVLAPNSAAISLREHGDNVAAVALTDADFANDSVVLVSGSYFAD